MPAAMVMKVRAFHFLAPSGANRIAAHAEFEDGKARSWLGDSFDGREKLEVGFGKTGYAFPLNWAGTVDGRDQHGLAGSVYMNAAGISKSELSIGAYGVARTNLPDGDLHGQVPGNNFPIHSVGRADENGLVWNSAPQLRLVQGDQQQSLEAAPQPAVEFGASWGGSKRNVWVEIEVFAPEITPRRVHPHDAASAHALMEALNIRIESPLLKEAQQMTFGGNVGPGENNVLARFSMNHPRLNWQAEPGLYPVRIVMGEGDRQRTLGMFTVDFKRT